MRLEDLDPSVLDGKPELTGQEQLELLASHLMPPATTQFSGLRAAKKVIEVVLICNDLRSDACFVGDNAHHRAHEVKGAVLVRRGLEALDGGGTIGRRTIDSPLDRRHDAARVLFRQLLETSNTTKARKRGGRPVADLNDDLIGHEPFSGNVSPGGGLFSPGANFLRYSELTPRERTSAL